MSLTHGIRAADGRWSLSASPEGVQVDARAFMTFAEADDFARRLQRFVAFAKDQAAAAPAYAHGPQCGAALGRCPDRADHRIWTRTTP